MRHSVIMAIIFFLAWNANAYDPSWPSQKEIATLPPYCKALLVGGAGSPEYSMWAAKLGNGFGHTHHYCVGLNFVRRAMLTKESGSDKYNLGQQALIEFNYVISNAPPTYILMPEILVQKGKTLVNLGQNGAAAQSFQKAIQLNPKYQPAYASMSDMYAKLGNKEESIKILQEGLRHNPQAGYLKKKLATLSK